jgi:hypothetical protein
MSGAHLTSYVMLTGGSFLWVEVIADIAAVKMK